MTIDSRIRILSVLVASLLVAVAVLAAWCAVQSQTMARILRGRVRARGGDGGAGSHAQGGRAAGGRGEQDKFPRQCG
jgi:hypothetical protein